MRWPGFRDDGALLLPLEGTRFLPDGSPARVRLDGRVLQRKHELHATVLGRDAGTRLREVCGEERMRAMFDALDWQLQGTRRYALVHKSKPQWDGPLDAWSVIEHLHAPAFARFRHALAEASGLPIDSGVPHVTLYVAGDPYGIGLPDVATYRACHVREVAASEIAPAAPPVRG